MENIDILAGRIQKLHDFFQHYAYKQIDQSLTFRNWLIGCIIFEFEQEGNNRASYGEKTISLLAKKLKKESSLSFSSRSLRLYRQFYTVYPQIFLSRNAKLYLAQNKAAKIWQLPIAKLSESAKLTEIEQHTPIDTLLDRLSFTHFIELIRFEDPLKRAFYEIQSIKNNWSVAELKRNINSLLFDRIALSKNKEKMIAKLKKETLQKPADLLKEPYMLEFLDMEERDSALVHYATGGLPQEVFVGKYMLQLPKEDDLKNLVREDVAKYGD